MAISHCYWHPVVKNGNCQIYLRICWQFYPQMHHGIYIMGCIWQPFCILQENVGIFCYFWIIRVVNSQLAWYSHVRCNSPQHSQHTQNTPHMTIANFNYEGSYFPGLICNIVVKTDLGRSSSRSTPTPQNTSGDKYYDMYLAAILVSSRKVGASSYFWIIQAVNSQLV